MHTCGFSRFRIYDLCIRYCTACSTPSMSERRALSVELRLTVDQVNQWFDRRRRRANRERSAYVIWSHTNNFHIGVPAILLCTALLCITSCYVCSTIVHHMCKCCVPHTPAMLLCSKAAQMLKRCVPHTRRCNAEWTFACGMCHFGSTESFTSVQINYLNASFQSKHIFQSIFYKSPLFACTRSCLAHRVVALSQPNRMIYACDQQCRCCDRTFARHLITHLISSVCGNSRSQYHAKS